MIAPTEYGASEAASELRVQPATVAPLLPDLFDRPRGDQIVNLLHEPHGLLEGNAHQVGDSYNHYGSHDAYDTGRYLNARDGDGDIDDDGDAALEARRRPCAEPIIMIITTVAAVFIITVVILFMNTMVTRAMFIMFIMISVGSSITRRS